MLSREDAIQFLDIFIVAIYTSLPVIGGENQYNDPRSAIAAKKEILLPSEKEILMP
jgi:hypothetical protein